MHPDYPGPTIVCNTTGTGLQPDILDITGFRNSFYPPVIAITISATATVKVWGAMSLSGTTVGALVRPIDYSAGGFTASDAYDLIPGIPFWQIEVTANTGTVVVECGMGPMTDDSVGRAQTIRYTNAATQGM